MICKIAKRGSAMKFMYTTFSHWLAEFWLEYHLRKIEWALVLNTLCTILRQNLSHNMTKPNKVTLRPVKTQISLGIHPVWSESLLSAWRKLGSLATHSAHSEDSDQPGHPPRLIWVFAECTLTLLVLSCHGLNKFLYSYDNFIKIPVWYTSLNRLYKWSQLGMQNKWSVKIWTQSHFLIDVSWARLFTDKFLLQSC